MMTDSTGSLHERLRPLLATVNGAMASHAGGIELTNIVEGAVHIKFIGMCQGCPLRPVTMEHIIRPILGEAQGVTDLVVAGSRLSAEAEARLRMAFSSTNDKGDGGVSR